MAQLKVERRSKSVGGAIRHPGRPKPAHGLGAMWDELRQIAIKTDKADKWAARERSNND